MSAGLVRGPSSPGDPSAQHIPAIINNSSAWLLHSPLHPPGGICTLSSPAAEAVMWGGRGFLGLPFPLWGQVGNIPPRVATELKPHGHVG